MKNLKIASALLVSIALVLLVVQNTDPVATRFLWFTAEVPAVLLLFLTTAGGFVVGLLVALIAGRRKR